MHILDDRGRSFDCEAKWHDGVRLRLVSRSTAQRWLEVDELRDVSISTRHESVCVEQGAVIVRST